MTSKKHPPVCVINVVGLTKKSLGAKTPALEGLRRRGGLVALNGVVPAVTSTVQATLLTGSLPSRHGIVANGWLYRETREIRFWQQSRHLLQAEPVYETARERARTLGRPFKSANLFWWFNQGAGVDISVTPKPYYGADGSKHFAVSTTPSGLEEKLVAKLGPFPFHTFWGPMAGLPSSEWIARCANQVITEHRPDLTLVYLPHLDYDLQRFGPDSAGTSDRLQEVDACVAYVLDAAKEAGAVTVVVSEYGLVPVRRPISINRALRLKGWLVVRDGPFGETLETFRSRAFAVVDHQVAHVYIDDDRLIEEVYRELEALDGVGRVLKKQDLREFGLDHPRSGELVAFAQADAWFAYPYWLDDSRAPDFARTVDIHRKPGYDPAELFFDPALRFPKGSAFLRLAKKKLGFRMLMDLIPLDAGLVRGSHGLLPSGDNAPILISDRPEVFTEDPFPMTSVKDAILRLLDLESAGSGTQ